MPAEESAFPSCRLVLPRIYEPPPAYRQLGLPLGDGPPLPRVAWARLNGRVHRLRYWTVEEWLQTPEDEQPGGTIVGVRGGRFLIVAEGV